MKIRSLLIALLVAVPLVACNSGQGNSQSSSIQSSTATAQMKESPSVANTTVTNSLNLSGHFITSSYEESGVLYVGTNMGLYISSDNGTTWNVISPKATGLSNSDYIYNVAVDGDTIYILAGYNNFGNYTLVSRDKGKTWCHFGTNYEDATSMFVLQHAIYLVYGGDSSAMGSPNSSPIIKVSRDQGNTWTTIANITSPYISYATSLYVDTTNTNNIYFIDPSSYAVYGSRDGGKSWVNNHVYDYPTSVVARGDYVYVSTTNGIRWANEWLVYGVTQCGTNVTCGGGLSYILNKSNGLGSNNIYQLALDDDNKLFAATDNGYSVGFFNTTNHYRDFANYTASVYNDLPTSVVSNVYANKSTVIIGTSNGFSLHNNSNNIAWEQSQQSSSMGTFSAAATKDNTFYYSAYNQGVTVVKPNTIKHIGYTGNNTGLYDPYSLNTLISGSNIYTGSLGGISISHDNGETWIYKSVADGITSPVNSIAVSENEIYLGTYGSGIYISRDGGNTWENHHINGKDDVVYSIYMDNGIIYAGAYQGGLSVSLDKGNTWTNYLSSVTVKSVVAAGNGIYVAATDGIYISMDSGKTWSKTTNNLNDQSVNSIYVSAGIIYAGLADGSAAISLDNGHTFTHYALQSNYPTKVIYETSRSIIVGNRNNNIIYGSPVK